VPGAGRGDARDDRGSIDRESTIERWPVVRNRRSSRRAGWPSWGRARMLTRQPNAW